MSGSSQWRWVHEGRASWTSCWTSWTTEYQLLNGGNLLAVVVFLELDELWLHVLYKGITLGSFELDEKLFCTDIR